MFGKGFLLTTLLITASLFSIPASFEDYTLVEVPGDLIDAEISSDGGLFMLLRGMPHLIVMKSDGSRNEFDLAEVLLPGGICIDQRWGWFVTGEITGMVYRYDASGVLAEKEEASGLPGDVCISGLSLFYVSREEGEVLSLHEPDMDPIRLEDSGEGQLSSNGNRCIYSDGSESIVFGRYISQQQLPSVGTWTWAGEDRVVLTDSCLFSSTGTELLRLPDSGEYTRLSFSPDGIRCILWSPGGDSILVFQ